MHGGLQTNVSVQGSFPQNQDVNTCLIYYHIHRMVAPNQSWCCDLAAAGSCETGQQVFTHHLNLDALARGVEQTRTWERGSQRSEVTLTITLNLSQGNGGRGDGWGTEVSRQGLGRVGGHAPEILLPKHLPPGGRAGERLRSILSRQDATCENQTITLIHFSAGWSVCLPHQVVSRFPWRWGSCTLAPGAVWPAGEREVM